MYQVRSSTTQVDAQRRLSRAVGDARLLGAVFVILGALFCIPLVLTPPSLMIQLLMLSAGLLLLGPGVLYIIAAQALKKRKPSGAILARCAATAHVIACAGTIAIGVIGQFGEVGFMLVAPAGVTLFFVPALVAFLAGTRAALRAAQQLDVSGRAFEPVVAQVVPHQSSGSETSEISQPSVTTAQPIVNPRLK